MTTSLLSLTTDGVDESDGRPLWRCREAETVLGPYAVLERLGVGHRCETWLAWRTDAWCPVVVKLARPDQVDHPRARRSLQREVDALDGVVHPALPTLVGVHLDAEVPHVAMEYVDGPGLDEVVDETGPMDAASVVQLGVQLLPALRVLHQRGLAHLDVKPENVVLRDGRPLLVDFGSSRRLGSLQPAGQPVGTLGYAAPEQEACHPVSAEMDLYGLGTVLAEALTGAPYDGEPDLPTSPLGGIVRRLLGTDPAGRGEPAELLHALAACAPTPPWPSWLDQHMP